MNTTQTLPVPAQPVYARRANGEPLADLWGQLVTIDAKPATPYYGARPFSIVRQTRRGQTQHVATWLPTNHRATFAGKRDATRFVTEHERVYYAK